MKPLWLLVLLLLAISLGGLAVFASQPLLYSMEKDQRATLFHQNPVVLRQQVTNSSADLVPLMQDVIDQQQPMAVDIRLRDFDALKRDLSIYQSRYNTLRIKVVSLDMNEGEIRSFLLGAKEQSDILSKLMNQTASFDAVKKIADRPENRNDRDVQATVASQGAALRETIKTLYTSYQDDRVVMMNTSEKLGLDTKLYDETKAEIQKLVDEIDAADLSASGSGQGTGLSGGSGSGAGTDLTGTGYGSGSGSGLAGSGYGSGYGSEPQSRITLLLEPQQATYRESVQIIGLVTPAEGAMPVTLLLDGARILNTTTDAEGNFAAGYTAERIRTGEHTLSATTGSLTSAGRTLTVTGTGTVITLTAVSGVTNTIETGAACTGTVMANQPVRHAPVTVQYDGRGRVTTTTHEDGSFEVFVPLAPGSHTLRAQFSSEDYPLLPSVSSEIPVEILPVPLRFTDIASWNPLIIIGALAIILLGIIGAVYWYLHYRKKAALAGYFTRHAEAVQMREELEGIIKEALEEIPAAGQEAIPVNTLLDQYRTCLREQGISEAVFQAYLTLAGRIASNLHLPAYRHLTPRELSRHCAGENYAALFDRFVTLYETIRYAGSEQEQDRKGFFDHFMSLFGIIRHTDDETRKREKLMAFLQSETGGDRH